MVLLCPFRCCRFNSENSNETSNISLQTIKRQHHLNRSITFDTTNSIDTSSDLVDKTTNTFETTTYPIETTTYPIETTTYPIETRTYFVETTTSKPPQTSQKIVYEIYKKLLDEYKEIILEDPIRYETYELIVCRNIEELQALLVETNILQEKMNWLTINLIDEIQTHHTVIQANFFGLGDLINDLNKKTYKFIDEMKQREMVIEDQIQTKQATRDINNNIIDIHKILNVNNNETERDVDGEMKTKLLSLEKTMNKVFYEYGQMKDNIEKMIFYSTRTMPKKDNLYDKESDFYNKDDYVLFLRIILKTLTSFICFKKKLRIIRSNFNQQVIYFVFAKVKMLEEKREKYEQQIKLLLNQLSNEVTPVTNNNTSILREQPVTTQQVLFTAHPEVPETSEISKADEMHRLLSKGKQMLKTIEDIKNQHQQPPETISEKTVLEMYCNDCQQAEKEIVKQFLLASEVTNSKAIQITLSLNEEEYNDDFTSEIDYHFEPSDDYKTVAKEFEAVKLTCEQTWELIHKDRIECLQILRPLNATKQSIIRSLMNGFDHQYQYNILEQSIAFFGVMLCFENDIYDLLRPTHEPDNPTTEKQKQILSKKWVNFDNSDFNVKISKDNIEELTSLKLMYVHHCYLFFEYCQDCQNDQSGVNNQNVKDSQNCLNEFLFCIFFCMVKFYNDLATVDYLFQIMNLRLIDPLKQHPFCHTMCRYIFTSYIKEVRNDVSVSEKRDVSVSETRDVSTTEKSPDEYELETRSGIPDVNEKMQQDLKKWVQNLVSRLSSESLKMCQMEKVATTFK